ncbi:MAG TPA: hypothetical protein VN258_09875 [Mobilitalea sp.]|nr:hypothetical protein [Mobilitalea sp.]
MNNNEKQSFSKAMTYKNIPVSTTKKPVPEKPVPEKPAQMKLDIKPVKSAVEIRMPNPPANKDGLVSQERLQEAIIWSEILGKPLSKRRKRRI